MFVTARSSPVESPAAGPPEWFVLYTKSRQEKALAEDLAKARIGHFLPLIRCQRVHRGRKVEVLEPLFPGYIFLEGSIAEAYAADRTRRVSRIIRVPHQEQITWELQNIRLALERQAPLSPWSYLQAGMRVEVTQGPLLGLQGFVERNGDTGRLVIQVETLGQAVSVEIDGAFLSPI